MAGLLDNDLVKMLMIGPQNYYQDYQKQKNREQFQGLLGTLEQQGPVQPDQGLLQPRAPDQQFWLKAAAIPGFKDIAGQQLGIDAQVQGAMQRQTQEQGYQANNLTYAQQLAEERQRRVAELNYGLAVQDNQRKLAGTNASIQSSLASAGSSNASRDLTNSRLTEQNLKNRNATGTLYDQLPPAEKAKAQDEFMVMDGFAQGAMDSADWAKNRPPGGLGTAAGAAFQQQWQTTVKPAFAKAMAMGVIQGPEGEELAKIMGKPDSYYLSDSDINVIDTAAEMIRQNRERTYKKYGLQAPKLVKGQSPASIATSANKGAKPQGNLRDWSPPTDTGTIWSPVQRTR